MGTAAVLILVVAGVVVAALLCLGAVWTAVRWTRRRPLPYATGTAPSAGEAGRMSVKTRYP
ncbi:hypothetical protein [Nocardia wallacei]|uniref:Uncharacterized protein n=1 Tax=Nocardia wallacei TaxID=480035 RepID=A0A7G1KN68_9NOCA|nr:hypothetical protein [Nocardia wallacei]BCK56066.1 hypothetical protein NWFMUON74_38380 [Nocardia wallacei]